MSNRTICIALLKVLHNSLLSEFVQQSLVHISVRLKAAVDEGGRGVDDGVPCRPTPFAVLVRRYCKRCRNRITAPVGQQQTLVVVIGALKRMW